MLSKRFPYAIYYSIEEELIVIVFGGFWTCGVIPRRYGRLLRADESIIRGTNRWHPNN